MTKKKKEGHFYTDGDEFFPSVIKIIAIGKTKYLISYIGPKFDEDNRSSLDKDLVDSVYFKEVE